MKRALLSIFTLAFTFSLSAQKTFTEPITVLPGHTDDLDALAVSPAGDMIVTGSWDKNINVYRADSGYTMLKQLTGHLGPVNAVRFNKTGKLLASGSSTDFAVKLWDSAWKVRTFEGHKANVNCVIFEGQSKYLFSGSDDRSVIAWEVATGKPFRTINHGQYVNSLAMAGNDPRYLYVAASEPKIKVYNLANLQVIKSFDGHTDAVNAIEISPNNQYLISGSNDKSARIWDMKTGKELRKLTVECWKVQAVAFSENSKYALTGCNDGSVRVWEVETGKLISKIETPGNNIRDVAFLKGMVNLASANMLRGSKEYGLKIWPTGISFNVPAAAPADTVKNAPPAVVPPKKK